MAQQSSSQARSAAEQRLSEHEEVLASSSVMLVMAGLALLRVGQCVELHPAWRRSSCLGQSRGKVRPRAARICQTHVQMRPGCFCLPPNGKYIVYHFHQILIHPCQAGYAYVISFAFIHA